MCATRAPGTISSPSKLLCFPECACGWSLVPTPQDLGSCRRLARCTNTVPKKINWSGKTHLKYGWHRPWSGGPRCNKKGIQERQLNSRLFFSLFSGQRDGDSCKRCRWLLVAESRSLRTTETCWYLLYSSSNLTRVIIYNLKSEL